MRVTLNGPHNEEAFSFVVTMCKMYIAYIFFVSFCPTHREREKETETERDRERETDRQRQKVR